MIAADPVEILNRLVVIHHRSLPAYLRYASPTWHRGDDRAREVLEGIARDHEQMVDRLGEMIMDRDGAVLMGGFSMVYTDYHDLGFEFLLRRLIQHQETDLEEIERCAAMLENEPLAQALALEALGAAKAHLELLLELRRDAVRTPS